MKTEIYTCDLCKKSVGSNQLSHITLNTRGITLSPNKYHSDIKIDICKDCLKKKGFIIEATPEEVEQADKANQKTIESKIIDILEDLGVAFHE